MHADQAAPRLTEDRKGQRCKAADLHTATACARFSEPLGSGPTFHGLDEQDGQGMPDHAVVHIASSLSGSHFCEWSFAAACAPRAVPQPCPLILDHFPQAQFAQLVG